MNYQQNYQSAYASAQQMMDPYASAAAAAGMAPQAPDYSYASAPASYGGAPVAAPGAAMGGMAGMHPQQLQAQQQVMQQQQPAAAQFEYGGGQQFAPHMGGGVAAPYYGAGQPAGGVTPPTRAGAVASNTSSKDPSALRARVFVGNLNTSIVNRDQVHQIYAPFGQILAISMHKGFAFVQYAYESEARNAVTFTDGTLLGGKRIDVTISSEPKKGSSANESSGTKRPAAALNNFGSDAKRMNTTSMSFKKPAASFSSLAKSVATSNKTITVSANGTGPAITIKQDLLDKGEDILICGRCRNSFSTVVLFSTHKSKCTVTPVLGCSIKIEKTDGANNSNSSDSPTNGKPDGEPAKVQCFICHLGFDHSWHLLQHMSQKHSMTVYDSATDGTTDTNNA